MLSRGCAIRPNCSGSSWLPSIPFECSGVERRHGDMVAVTFREEGRNDRKKKAESENLSTSRHQRSRDVDRRRRHTEGEEMKPD